MTYDIEKLLELLKGIALTTLEREALKERLEGVIYARPARLSTREGAIPSPLSRTFIYIRTHRMVPIIAGLILALSAGGGTALAAEGAVPGDILYPVKVGINEEVRAAVAVSAEAKADWEARLIERRLDEATKLASEGSFDEEKRVALEARIESRIEKAQERIAHLTERGASEAAIEASARFEASLTAYHDLVASFETDGIALSAMPIEATGLMKAADTVREAAPREIRVAADTETKGSLRVSKERVYRAHEEAVSLHARAFGQYEDAKDTLSARARSGIETQLTLGARALTEGDEALKKEAYAKAFVNYQESIRHSHAAQGLTEAHLRAKTGAAPLPLPRFDAELKMKVETHSVDAGLEMETEVETETEVEHEGIDDSSPEGSGEGKLRLKLPL